MLKVNTGLQHWVITHTPTRPTSSVLPPTTDISQGYPWWRGWITAHWVAVTSTDKAVRLPGFEDQPHHLMTVWSSTIYLFLYKIRGKKCLHLAYRMAEKLMLRIGPASSKYKLLSWTRIIRGRWQKICSLASKHKPTSLRSPASAPGWRPSPTAFILHLPALAPHTPASQGCSLESWSIPQPPPGTQSPGPFCLASPYSSSRSQLSSSSSQKRPEAHTVKKAQASLCPQDPLFLFWTHTTRTRTPGHLLDSGIEPPSPASPTLAGGFFTSEPPGKALEVLRTQNLKERCLRGKDCAISPLLQKQEELLWGMLSKVVWW